MPGPFAYPNWHLDVTERHLEHLGASTLVQVLFENRILHLEAINSPRRLVKLSTTGSSITLMVEGLGAGMEFMTGDPECDKEILELFTSAYVSLALVGFDSIGAINRNEGGSPFWRSRRGDVIDISEDRHWNLRKRFSIILGRLFN